MFTASAPRTFLKPLFALLLAGALGQAALAQTITVTTNPAGQGTQANPILFEASAGSSAALSRQVTLAISGASGSVFRQNTTLPAWLTVSGLPSAQGTSAVVTFTANPLLASGGASGTYDGSVEVRYDFGTNQSASMLLYFRLVIGGGSATTLISNPTSLSFFGVPLTNAANTQTVNISNTGSPISYQVTTTTTNGINWLSTNVAGVTLSTPNSFQVTANASQLSANATAYTGTVILTPTGGGQATQIPVTFQVSNTTQFQASPNSLSFSYTTGSSPTVLSQNLSLSISTGAAVGFSAGVNYLTGSQNWLSVTPNSGTASTTAQTLTVQANMTGLSIGTSTAEIRITGSASNSPLVIPVTLVVSAPGVLTASPSNLIEFAAQPGSSAGPRAINVSVTAGGAQQFTPSAVYTNPASPLVQWLTVSATSNTTPSQVNVSVVTSSGSNTLAAGTYDGAVRLTPTTGTPIDVPVRLTVTNNQVMSVNVSSLTFNSTVGNAAVPQSIQISLSPATPNQGYSINFEPSGGAPSGMITATPSFGTLAGNTAISIGTNPAGLTAGTYTGVLRVFGVGSVFPSSIGIPVTYTVTNSGTGTGNNDLTLPSQLQFFTIGGSLNQLEQQFTLTGTNSNPVNFTLTPSVFNGSGWLTVTPTSGVTPATITVRVNPSILSSGTSYIGQVLLTNSGTPRDNTAIGITVQASTAAQIQATPSALTFVYQAGSLNIPSFQTVALTSTNGSALPFTTSISSGTSWLTVSPTSASTTSSIAVSLNASALLGLTAGTYDTTVQVNTPGAQNSVMNVPVRLVVTGSTTGGGGTGQTLTISPSSQLQFFSLQNGGSQQQIISIAANTGTPSFTVSANSGIGTNWLTASVQNNNQVVVTATPGTLTPATYTGSVTISSAALPGGSTVIPVSLTVTALTAVVPSPQGLVFTYTGTGSNPGQQTITLTTNTGGSLQYSASVSTTSGGNWLLLSQASGFTPGALVVAVNALSLPPGTYVGNITISTSGTINPSQSIEVRLLVTGTSSTNSFVFTPSTLSFIAAPNGVQPPNQTVQVSTSGPATNFIVSTSVQTPSGFNWLQAAATSSFTPGTISVGVNPAGIITLGTYTGTVSVTGGGLTSSFTVTLVISNNPQVQLSARALTFNHQINATLPAPRAVVVTSSIQTSTLNFGAQVSTSSGGNWLGVQQTTVGTPGAFLVSLNPNIVNSLPAGSYTGQISVSATGADNSPVQIPVTLNIAATAQITLSNNSPVVFNAGFATASPPAQTITVGNTGAQPITIQATAQTSQGGNWLSATLNQNITPATLTISALSSGLSTGSYSGTVTVTSGASTVQIPVTLVVSSTTLLNVNTRELNFGGSSNQTQSLSITSTGATAGYTVQGIVSSPLGSNWLQVNPTQANGATPGTVQINVVPSSLADGTYFGYVSIASPGIPSVVIPVTLTINNATALTVAPTSLTFTMLQGQAPPSAQTVSVSSLVSTSFSVSQASSAGSFLDITPVSGLTNAVLQVRPNSLAANLGVGTYTSTVTLSGTSSPNVVQFTVTLNVTPAITLAASPQSLNFTGRAQSTQNPPAQTLTINASGGAIQGISVGATVDGGGNWLSVSPTTTQTPATVSVQVSLTGLAAGSYTGAITVALSGAATTPVIRIPVSLTVERAAVPNITQVVNGASFQPGSLAPGLITTIFGSNLGPEVGLGVQLTSGRVSTNTGSIRVLFDGVPAPLLFVRADQINCVVPYALTGRAQATIQVENNGVLSNQIIQRINDTAPGIFNLGSGQAALLNQNNSVNGISNPADRGTVAVLYMTGEGALTPPGVDGEVTATIKRPIAPVSMRVGGVDVTNIQFVGAAPGLVQGVLQINFVIPANAPTGGNVPLTVTIGGANSQAGMTMAVR